MLKEDITDKRKERHSETQEDFTPPEILDIMFSGMDEQLYTNFKKTFCDPCIGTGNIYLYVLERRLKYCKTPNDVYKAISTLYGTELMEDNTEECRERILMMLLKFSAKHNMNLKDKKIIKILNHNIVCTNTFKWDYENWGPIKEYKNEALF